MIREIWSLLVDTFWPRCLFCGARARYVYCAEHRGVG
jgi:hypothetical protein